MYISVELRYVLFELMIIFKNTSQIWGKNLNPYSIALRHENFYFLTPHLNFFTGGKIKDNELLKTNKK